MTDSGVAVANMGTTRFYPLGDVGKTSLDEITLSPSMPSELNMFLGEVCVKDTPEADFANSLDLEGCTAIVADSCIEFTNLEFYSKDFRPISSNHWNTYINNIMIDPRDSSALEEFLSPRFFIKMPYREKTTVEATVKSVSRGFPRSLDFED